jgi:uncharacterized protein YtpQ (UPF0354 family)
MKRLIAGLLIVVGLCGAAWAESARKLSPAEFRTEFIRALMAAVPSATIAASGDLELIIRRGERTTTVNLANSYTLYSREPERLKALIDTQVAIVAAPSATGATVDPSRIIPVIKDRAWLLEVQRNIKATGAQQEQLIEELNSELLIAYAEDSEHAIRSLTTKEYSGERRGLRDLAIKNLLRVLPKIEMYTFNEHVSAISAGEDYTPGLLLLDNIWSGGQIKVQGDIVVAVPTRAAILVTGSRSSRMNDFRALVADFYAKGPHSISDKLFVYRDKRFTTFGRN